MHRSQRSYRAEGRDKARNIAACALNQTEVCRL
jgi:hypothetical protein